MTPIIPTRQLYQSKLLASSADNVELKDKILAVNFIAKENIRTKLISRISLKLKKLVLRYLIPSGELSADYYSYVYLRLLQRFVASTLAVFGTQALLLALGDVINDDCY